MNEAICGKTATLDIASLIRATLLTERFACRHLRPVGHNSEAYCAGLAPSRGLRFANPPYALIRATNLHNPSFVISDAQLRIADAPLGAGPESKIQRWFMDSGLAQERAPE
jgi:hypothetical protein